MNFTPTQPQRRAKAKLYSYIKKNGIDLADMEASALPAACGSRSIRHWMEDEEFKGWFYEEGTASINVAATVDAAIARLAAIIATPDHELNVKGGHTTSDVLKAVNTVLQLADLFPKKKTIEKWMDASVAKLDEQSTDAEIKLLDSRLGDIK